LPVHLHQDYLQRPRRRSLLVVGQSGKIEWDLANGSFVHYGPDGAVVERHDFSDHPRNRTYLDELSHFLDAVAGRARAEVGITAAADSLRIALSILESQASGEPVRLQWARAA
jgi:predicted dehydrogenase